MRTKEEIVESIEAVKREVKHYENRRESMCAQLATLEAELAALPKEPVKLVVRGSDRFNTRIYAGHDEAWTVSVDDIVCRHHGIDPAHLVRFITTYPIVPRLLDAMFDDKGHTRYVAREKDTQEIRDLARRYHDAMKGGAA